MASGLVGSGLSLLDIGCGRIPDFAASAAFVNKYVYDPALAVFTLANIEDAPRVDAVTMLAVLEHLTMDEAREMVSRAYDKMTVGGVLVVTTPDRWTHGLLLGLARLGLVSSTEIMEHKTYFTKESLRSLLSGFSSVCVGRFMFGCNLWAKARK
jgi:hypothetical protein